MAVKPPEPLHRGQGSNLCDVLFIAVSQGAHLGFPEEPASAVVQQEVLCPSRDNTAVFLLLLFRHFSFHVFLLIIFPRAVFILTMVPTIVISPELDLLHLLAAAVATASQSESITS